MGCFLIFMVSPKQAILFIIVFLILQQIEGNLIYPHVVGGSVGLPSIWVLAAVTIGGNLMGIVGMLIFIPLVSVLYTIFREFVYLRLKEKNIKQVTKTVVEEYTAEEIAAMEKIIKKNRDKEEKQKQENLISSRCFRFCVLCFTRETKESRYLKFSS